MIQGGARQLIEASPLPPQFLLEASLGHRGLSRKEIAKGYASAISRKLQSGLKEIKRYLKRGDSIIKCFSGKTSDQVDGSRWTHSNATYEDILSSFLEDARQCQRERRASKFFAWCMNFNAGTLDCIVNCLPPQRVANSETDTTTGGCKAKGDNAKRKHRRDLARVVNAIVHRLPSQSRVIYVALGRR